MSRLYVSDLDGTLLDPSGRLSDVSLDILSGLIADGLPFTVASARSVVSMREVLRGLPLRLPVVELNGAFISDLGTGRHMHCEAIARAAAEAVVAAGGRRGLRPVIATFDGQADRVHHLPPENPGIAGYVAGRRAAGDPRLRQVTSLVPALGEQVVSITFMDLRENLEPLRDDLRALDGDGVQAFLYPEQYFLPWFWLAVSSARATKARAVEALARGTGVELADVTVFGDQVNDIPMFEECGHAVAVANGVPELLAHSDEVIGHHDTDSVARYLQRVWRGRGIRGGNRLEGARS